MCPQSPTAWVLSRRPMTYLGRISYGTYLWHWPIIVLAGAVVDVSPKVMTALAVVGATGLASLSYHLSYHLIEYPIRSAGWLAARQRPVVAVGLAASLVGGLVVVPAILSSGRPTSVAPVASAASAVSGDVPDAELPPDVPWEAAREDTPEIPDCRGRPVEECAVRGAGGPEHDRGRLPLPRPALRAHLVAGHGRPRLSGAAVVLARRRRPRRASGPPPPHRHLRRQPCGAAPPAARRLGRARGVVLKHRGPAQAGAGPRHRSQPNGLKSCPRTAPPGWLSVWMFM